MPRIQFMVGARPRRVAFALFWLLGLLLVGQAVPTRSTPSTSPSIDPEWGLKPSYPADQEPAALTDPHPPRELSSRFAMLGNWPEAEEDPAIDVLHYDLDLRFGLGGKEVAGTATITLLWGSDPDGILDLDLGQPTVLGVTTKSGEPLLFAHGGGTLSIVLPSKPDPGDQVEVKVTYEAPATMSYVTGVNSSFTFTEPNGSRDWFPCNDVPWDKARLTLRGRVAAGKRCVSNGFLDYVLPMGPETLYVWREDHPIATYLIAVAVADYAEVVPSSSPIVPMAWYVYPGKEAEAEAAFQNVPAMMSFYDSLLTPYPFDKYVMVEGNFGGGMEHQTCSLIGETVVSSGLLYEWITAHELAHQWFGNQVTLKDWQHIWLNEGFASFYDVVWHEHFYGPQVFKDRLLEFENSVIAFEGARPNRFPLVDPPVDNLFNTLIYKKGAWVLYMLRTLIGETTFNQAIIEYLDTHKYSNADTDDLQAVMEAHHGADLDWFFNPWLYGSGSPRLSYFTMFHQFASGWVVQLDIKQVQKTSTVFRLPLQVRVQTLGGPRDFSVWVDTTHEIYQLDVPHQPISVELDPDNLILGTNEIAFATAADAVTPGRPGLRAWPVPFSHRLQLAGPEDAAGPLNLDVFDARGRRVRELGEWSPERASLWWDGRDKSGRRLAPGTYFVRARETGEATRVLLVD